MFDAIYLVFLSLFPSCHKAIQRKSFTSKVDKLFYTDPQTRFVLDYKNSFTEQKHSLELGFV